MEGERKKRKISIEDDEHQQEDDDLDLKMDKFFALIRSAKDIRDRLLDSDESTKSPAIPAARVDDAAETEKLRPNRMQSLLDLNEKIETRETSSRMNNEQQQSGNCCCAMRLEEEEGEKSKDDDSSSNHFQGRRFELDLNLSL